MALGYGRSQTPRCGVCNPARLLLRGLQPRRRQLNPAGMFLRYRRQGPVLRGSRGSRGLNSRACVELQRATGAATAAAAATSAPLLKAGSPYVPERHAACTRRPSHAVTPARSRRARVRASDCGTLSRRSGAPIKAPPLKGASKEREPLCALLRSLRAALVRATAGSCSTGGVRGVSAPSRARCLRRCRSPPTGGPGGVLRRWRG